MRSTTGSTWSAGCAEGAEGALLGAEGTGKSTLLASMAREAERRGLRVQQVTVSHDGSTPCLSVDDGHHDLLCADEADRLSSSKLTTKSP